MKLEARKYLYDIPRSGPSSRTPLRRARPQTLVIQEVV